MSPITITIPSFTLNGWKTYVFAAALIGLSVAHSYGYVSNELYDILLPILGGGGLAALRSAVTKNGPQSIMEGVNNLVTAAIQMQPPAQSPEMKPPAVGLAALRSGLARSAADKPKEVGSEQAVAVSGTTQIIQGNVGGNL
ncbi:MAG: hypothetical protein ACOZFS_08190 [Thermodesulfobacteriota bacterium]